MYVCARRVFYICRGQKRVSDPLESELQKVVRHHVLEIKPGSLEEQLRLLTVQSSFQDRP